MSMPMIACSACGEAVPYGRLSCPACGELLASVAGRARRVPVALSPAEAPTLLPDPVDEPGSESGRPGDDEPAFAAGDLGDLVDLRDDGLGEAGSAVLMPSIAPIRSESGPRAVPPTLVDAKTPSTPPTTPGAYVPPGIPAGPALPARAWEGQGAAAASAVEVPSRGNPRGPRGALTGPLDRIDPAKVTEFVDWLAIAGAALAAVGFLLPWSVTVIGGSGVGYFDRWGLAGPGHPLLVVALLAVLALAFLPNPVPGWLRVGVAGLGLGSFLVGLLWPYTVGPLGSMPGAVASLVGAVMLMSAGIVSVALGRHAEPSRGV